MKKLPAGPKHGEGPFEISVKVFLRNVLGRTDADNTIETLLAAVFEKVFHFDPAPTFQASGANTLARNLRLLRTQRQPSALTP